MQQVCARFIALLHVESCIIA